MVSYAVSYEKAVFDRPVRCGVDPFAIVPAYPKSPGKTAQPLVAHHPRRDLLPAPYRMPVALPPARLPTLANGLLPLPPLPLEWYVVPHPHGTPGSGAAACGQGSAADGSDHRRP